MFKKTGTKVIICYLISMVGALVGWATFGFGTKYLIDWLQEKNPDTFAKNGGLKKTALVIFLVILYASYNYYVVSPLIGNR